MPETRQLRRSNSNWRTEWSTLGHCPQLPMAYPVCRQNKRWSRTMTSSPLPQLLVLDSPCHPAGWSRSTAISSTVPPLAFVRVFSALRSPSRNPWLSPDSRRRRYHRSYPSYPTFLDCAPHVLYIEPVPSSCHSRCACTCYHFSPTHPSPFFLSCFPPSRPFRRFAREGGTCVRSGPAYLVGSGYHQRWLEAHCR